MSAKTAMLEAQKSLQDAMEVKNASEEKKKTKKRKEVSSPSSTSSSPIRVPERKDSRPNVKQNVRQERKQSDASLASQKSEERTIIKEGTLLKKNEQEFVSRMERSACQGRLGGCYLRACSEWIVWNWSNSSSSVLRYQGCGIT